MKIFIVCNSLGGGGAERVGVNLANGFAQHGHQAYIITDIYQPASYPVDTNVTVLPFYSRTKGRVKRWINGTKNLHRYIKQEQPDVVIGFMHLCSLISCVAAIGTKASTVMTVHHALESDTYKFSKFEQFLDRHTPCLYNATTVLTHPDKECMGDRKNIFVMPNPVTFTAADNIPKKEKIVLAAGRLNDWRYKGWDVLINAWKSLYYDNVDDDDNLRDWWLKIAGEGKKESLEYLLSLLPDGEWLHDDNVNDDDNHEGFLCRSEKYHIEFMGFQKDMEPLYKKSEIFVLSSRSEGLPMVLIEAMSQGCAPIATDFKGRTKEIITSDKEGLTCNPENIAALAAGILQLMADEELRKTIQQNAIERSKFFSLDNIISLWEKFLYNDMKILKS